MNPLFPFVPSSEASRGTKGINVHCLVSLAKNQPFPESLGGVRAFECVGRTRQMSSPRNKKRVNRDRTGHPLP